jgi:hypothetical protein
VPSSTSAISWAIDSIASAKRSSSAFDSDSVGSTIRVPATGQDIVGAWKPWSMSRLAMSSTLMPARLLRGSDVDDGLVRDQPGGTGVEHVERRTEARSEVVGVEDRGRVAAATPLAPISRT